MSTTRPTPTTPSAYVPQVVLPRQHAAPEGPVDMTMMYVMHHAFRRDLAHFSEAVPRTPVGDARSWAALLARWELFSQALHHHHAGEDAHLWPFLLERADAEERATLEAMEAEHADIDPLLQACHDGLRTMATSPDDDTRAALTVRLVAAREHLARHLAHEEGDSIALMQRVMTNAEWHALDEKFKAGVSFGQVLALVPWALHEVPADVRQRLFGEPGGTVHRLVWVLTRRRFARADATAFAHLPRTA